MKNIMIVSLFAFASCSQNNLTEIERQELNTLRAKNGEVVGRFQYVPQSNGYVNRGKLIDTATGKIWQDTCYKKDKTGECAASAWSEETVIGLNYSLEAWGKYLELLEEKDRRPSSIDSEKDEYQQVRGYIKSNGTYVAPHIRSSPNGTTYDNIRPKK